MRLAGTVCDEWSAHLMDRLIARGAPIETVLVATCAARRLWRNRPSSARVAGVDRLTSDYDRVINARSERIAVDIPQVTAAVWCPDGLVTSDPVQWCIRNACDVIEAGWLGSSTVRLRIDAVDHDGATDMVAEALVPRLRDAVPDASLAVELPFPLNREMLRVDWSSSADRIARLVRSSAGRSTAAWTCLNGIPISIVRAEPVDTSAVDRPFGTIVSRQESDVVVRAGDGCVAVTTRFDISGAACDVDVAPGMRFDADEVGELLALRRRVTGLEELVSRLRTENAAMLSAVASGSLGGPIDLHRP